MNQQNNDISGARVQHQDVGRITALPENWYMLAASPALKRGAVLSVSLMNRDIVLYRGVGGIAAYAAKCAHMGCHLKHATGDGDGIRCAMHQRLIALDGAFVRPDGQKSSDLVQRTYPVQEAFGGVWIWLGQGPPRPFPVPDIAGQGAIMSRYAGDYQADISWYSLVANGCDMEHLAAVHDRELREEPVVDAPQTGQFRIAYLTRVTGRGIVDRVVKYLSGDHVRASMTLCNGSMMLVQSKVWKPSFFVLSMCPDGQGGTMVRAAVGAQGDGGLLARLRLWLTAKMFIGFLAKDFEVMKGLQWHPPTRPHSFGDRTSQHLFQYFTNLKGVPDDDTR